MSDKGVLLIFAIKQVYTSLKVKLFTCKWIPNDDHNIQERIGNILFNILPQSENSNQEC